LPTSRASRRNLADLDARDVHRRRLARREDRLAGSVVRVLIKGRVRAGGRLQGVGVKASQQPRLSRIPPARPLRAAWRHCVVQGGNPTKRDLRPLQGCRECKDNGCDRREEVA
jgi:hypothetical protein